MICGLLTPDAIMDDGYLMGNQQLGNTQMCSHFLRPWRERSSIQSAFVMVDSS